MLEPARRRRPTIITAEALMEQQFPPLEYVVRDFIAEGTCTLLAGAPKIGKSWLVSHFAIAVATGGICLGNIRCIQGSVLFLALEDNARRLQRRLRKLITAGDDAPERLHIATEWPRADQGGIDEIRRWIEDTHDARLVIVDVFAMFRPARGRADQPYESDYHAIKQLQEIASSTGVAIVIIHHTRKTAGEADPFEKVSGTLGLSGAADSVLILDRSGHGVTLFARGRDIEESEIAVVFDRVTCRWSIQGDAEDVRRSDERTQLLDLLKAASEPMAPIDIGAALGQSSGAVRVMLHRMMKAGEVRKVKGKALYLHPDRPGLDPSGPDTKIVTDVTGVTALEDDRVSHPLYPRNSGNARNAFDERGVS